MKRATLVLTALCLCGVGAAIALGGSGHRGHHTTAGDRYLGPVPPGRMVHFGLTLRMRGGALNRYAAAVGTGAKPALSAAAIGLRFGITDRELAHVRRVLSASGVRVEQTFKQRTELLVSASAARAERLLTVRLGEFRQSGGSRAFYHMPLGTPTVPRSLRTQVVNATQLDDRPLLTAEDVPRGGLAAPNLDALYDLRPLIAQGLDGRGQTVAVFSEDTFKDQDIAAFDRRHGISGSPAIRRVEVNGRVPYQGGNAAVEVDLDTEVIQELAPRARILNYESCCGPGAFAPGIDKIVSDGRAKLVNFSYGYCELRLTPLRVLRAANNSFAAAEAHGVTVFVSSGDQGAYECQRDDLADHRPSVPWPGSSPNVVSVGGTYVDVRQNSTRLDELGWEDILSRGGGGGGVSAVFPRPSWQTGVPGVENRFTTSPARREVPDVAAAASPGSGYAIVSGGADQMVGGTSAAAPLWTGAFALIDELSKRQTGRLLPFIGPLLYRAAGVDPRAFYDVVLGGNRFYRAGPGWDYSTGLGAPDFADLGNAVIAEAKR